MREWETKPRPLAEMSPREVAAEAREYGIALTDEVAEAAPGSARRALHMLRTDPNEYRVPR